MNEPIEPEYTRHARTRMRQRSIPEALVRETIERGKRVILPGRNAVEHRLKNVLGLRGINVVVITGAENGDVLTSYIEKIPRRYKR